MNPAAISDLHAKALSHLEHDKAKEAMSFVDITSGPEFPGSKVTTLAGHNSEVS